MRSVVTEERACQLVLETGEGPSLAVISCELSGRGDYWVIVANSEDYVLHGKLEALLLGVNAYLVHVVTGAITVVGSAQRWEDVVDDVHDLEVAAGRHYVLAPTCDPGDKRATVHLHQRLGCSLLEARYLLSPVGRDWLTGARRVLATARASLHAQGIATEIVLRAEAGTAAVVTADATWSLLSERIRRSAWHSPRLNEETSVDAE